MATRPLARLRKLHPDRFFVPPYVGPSGWVGVWLDEVVDWEDLADLLRDSYLLVAPKRLRTELEAPSRRSSS
jgi:predicted DNA-binding protein (MmcQ/YjbR family)